MKRSQERFELHSITSASEPSGTATPMYQSFFCSLHLSAAMCYLTWQTWSDQIHLHFVMWCSFIASTAGQDRWSGGGVSGGGGGTAKKYYGMHFDLYDNLTPPVTLLRHHHPSANLHGDQQHRSTIMVCTPPPLPSPPPPPFSFLPQK